MKYKKKGSIEVEAMQWDVIAAVNGDTSVLDWLKDAPVEFQDERILIKTFHGTFYVDGGDWIVRGSKNNYWPVKDHIFQEDYEAMK